MWFEKVRRRSLSGAILQILKRFKDGLSSLSETIADVDGPERDALTSLLQTVKRWEAFEGEPLTDQLLHSHLQPLGNEAVSVCCIPFVVGLHVFLAVRTGSEVCLAAFHLEEKGPCPQVFPSHWTRTSLQRLCSLETARQLCRLEPEGECCRLLGKWLLPCLSERGKNDVITPVEKKQPSSVGEEDICFAAVKGVLHVCIQSVMRFHALRENSVTNPPKDKSSFRSLNVRADLLYKAVRLAVERLFLESSVPDEEKIRLHSTKYARRARKLEIAASVWNGRDGTDLVDRVVSRAFQDLGRYYTSLERRVATQEEKEASVVFAPSELDFCKDREHKRLKNLDRTLPLPPPIATSEGDRVCLNRQAPFPPEATSHFEEADRIEETVRDVLWPLRKHLTPQHLQSCCAFASEASQSDSLPEVSAFLVQLMERYEEIASRLYASLVDPLCRSRQALTSALLTALLDVIACEVTPELLKAKCGLGPVVLSKEAPLRQAVLSEHADRRVLCELKEWVCERDAGAQGSDLLSPPSTSAPASLIIRGDSGVARGQKRVHREILAEVKRLK
uniref:Uncharacterized protein n=1 Tax=Chromera velia CCMP2878 TaxID=1169474 RepID=A0A0G4FS78_9ALVE|eukprot:Cvel_18509.t1-p1 / transcript=Cvel_18509.t1 / gene=Cvel_18509 / organism=Chromera_velia_CCMP2878 / gene_product=hypothetical protein / transcript_product=hypothetical protein / location=Cvel_scaffold1537:28301-29983(+) / protein_length=561 / sequence_SO=supercontig / SO=protein_coding / is_pseudo=false